jgi:hypothetical protein
MEAISFPKTNNGFKDEDGGEYGELEQLSVKVVSNGYILTSSYSEEEEELVFSTKQELIKAINEIL